MGTRDLLAKFRTYAHYVISREWFREHAGLPLLLMMTPGKEQEMRLHTSLQTSWLMRQDL